MKTHDSQTVCFSAMLRIVVVAVSQTMVDQRDYTPVDKVQMRNVVINTRGHVLWSNQQTEKTATLACKINSETFHVV